MCIWEMWTNANCFAFAFLAISAACIVVRCLYSVAFSCSSAE